jgi:pimeloyl-ACP methyl ester carboxylesterase
MKKPRRISPAKVKTFVLVPGTWHGGWAWTPVAQHLKAMGHRAFAVTTTGLGERAHLISPDVGLDTHVADVAGVIEAEELSNVILVGHSFGGITITGVADRLRDRIGHLVYFDAFIPTRARPAWVMRQANGAWPDWWEKRRAKFIDGYKMDFFAEYPIEMICPPEFPEVQALLKRRLTLHPAKQWTDPVSFANGGWEGLPRSYVSCVGQSLRASSAAMWGPAKEPGWTWRDLNAPRAAMLTHTDDTATLLAALS